MFNVQIHNLIDNSKCYQAVREIRWPDGPQSPHCFQTDVIKRGFDETESARQRYSCNHCQKRFDDLIKHRIFRSSSTFKNMDRLSSSDGTESV